MKIPKIYQSRDNKVLLIMNLSSIWKWIERFMVVTDVNNVTINSLQFLEIIKSSSINKDFLTVLRLTLKFIDWNAWNAKGFAMEEYFNPNLKPWLKIFAW